MVTTTNVRWVTTTIVPNSITSSYDEVDMTDLVAIDGPRILAARSRE
jgi:hypothetical protein